MMQMNFNFAPPRVTVVRQAVNQRFIVILSRIEMRVAQRLAFVVSQGADRRGVLATPFFQVPLLFTEIHTLT